VTRLPAAEQAQRVEGQPTIAARRGSAGGRGSGGPTEQLRRRQCKLGKVAKVAKVGSKMATRLPSTGLKMAKMAN
jgi:hypothetical protein